MKRKACFPAIGTVVTIPFVPEEPKREENESAEAFESRRSLSEVLRDAEIDVSLVQRAKVIEWSHRYDLWSATEDKRKADLERAEKIVPRLMTTEGTAELSELHSQIVIDCVVSVRGIVVGDVDLESVTDPRRVVSLLVDCVLLADVARMARSAQSPTPKQSDC